jgi:hypothetical protein
LTSFHIDGTEPDGIEFKMLSVATTDSGIAFVRAMRPNALWSDPHTCRIDQNFIRFAAVAQRLQRLRLSLIVSAGH